MMTCGRDGWPRQHRLMSAYQTALTDLTPDRRVPLKQGGPILEIGPHVAFANLVPTTKAELRTLAVQFTSEFGPLVWSPDRRRLRSRTLKPGERPIGVSVSRNPLMPLGEGRRRRRVVDRMEWLFPLSDFWKEQRRYRALWRLAAAVAAQRDQVPARLGEALDTIPEVWNHFAALARREDAQADVHGWLELQRAQPELLSRRHPEQWWFQARGRLAAEAGQVIAQILDQKSPPRRIAYHPREGFRLVTRCRDLRDVLYFLFAEALASGSYRLCANCGRLFLHTRSDKHTCSLRCAQLLGKRNWARRARTQKKLTDTTPEPRLTPR